MKNQRIVPFLFSVILFTCLFNYPSQASIPKLSPIKDCFFKGYGDSTLLGEKVNQNIGSARLSMALFHELTNSFTNMQLRDFNKTVDLTRAAFVTFNSSVFDSVLASVQSSSQNYDISVFFIYYDPNNALIRSYLGTKTEYLGRISVAIAFINKAVWTDPTTLNNPNVNRKEILKDNAGNYHIYNMGELCPDDCPTIIPPQ